MVDLLKDGIGTRHPRATCTWCGNPLVVGQVDQLRCWLCPLDYKRQVEKALRVKVVAGDHQRAVSAFLKMPAKVGTIVCLYVPLPSQAAFEETPAKNVLWGGQAGPGKSHGVRWWLYKRSLTVSGHEALLLRENWEQLDKHHLRKMRAEVPCLDGKVVDRTAVFKNGSFIDCGHMADAEAVARYLGFEYGAIVPDEASQTPVDAYGVTPLAELSTRARKVYTDVSGNEVRPRFMPVSNPGGPSASWLRDMFVDHTPDFETFPALKAVYDAAEWEYMPAKLDDNPYQDQEYEKTLANTTKTRYEQLRHGDWHAFAGQFFSAWRESAHARRLSIAMHTEWFASMDWGYNAPGCVLWWACLPDGHYHIAQEFKFQGMSAEEVAVAIQAKTKALGIKKLRYVVGDPAMWQKTGAGRGQSIAETLLRAQVPMRPGDNDRMNGWARCQTLLRTDAQDVPWLTVDESCPYLKRTIPAAVSDKKNPEDVDTSIDDHALDAWRYGAMSRPHPTRLETPEKPKGSAGKLLDECLTENAAA